MYRLLSVFAADNYRLYFIFLLVLSISALLGALLAQYLGFEPCHLCIYQRMPYIALIIIASLALVLRRWSKGLLLAAILLILSSIALSAYHSAVEMGIISLPESCSSKIDYAKLSFNQLKEQINDAKVVDCSKPAIVLFGLSMAQWNLLFNIALICISILILQVKTYAKTVLSRE